MVKTTYLFDEQLLADFGLIAKGKKTSKNKIIVELVSDYVAKNIEQARKIEQLKQELEQAEADIKG